MYRVSYGTRSWFTSPPVIEKKDVVKKTAKTVVYKYPIKRYVGGERKVMGFKENREHLESEGVKWFDDFDEAKAFAIADQERKLSENVVRVENIKENLNKLKTLKEGEEV